jgi:large subunit ribosomal protein L3
MIGILGRKIGMTTLQDENGKAFPVTVIEAGPCYVTQIKTKEKDGYEAVQLGFGEIRAKLVRRPRKGHFKKAGTGNLRHLKEFRNFPLDEVKLGQEIRLDIFKVGDKVRVSGTSKGKGFAGVMKRHNFKGFMGSHGVHESFRGPGSVGASSDPSRVWPGMKMAGHMGNERVTVINQRIVMIDSERNYLFIKGAVPGARNGLVEIRKRVD